MKLLDNNWSLLPEEGDLGYKTWKRNHNWQNGLIHRAMSYCKEFRTAIDIGAAYGATTFQLAKNFEEVYSIEMLPDLIPHLKNNTKEFDNIYYHNVALDKEECEENYYYYPKYSGRSGKNSQRKNKSWIDFSIEDEVELRLETKKLNFLLTTPTWRHWKSDDPTVVDLIKIDVEGSEHRVIKGGIRLIKQHNPVICVEHLTERLHNLLKDIDYVLIEKFRADNIFIPAQRLNDPNYNFSLRRRELINEW